MIKTDCIHFQLDKPCSFHKQSGVKCVCLNYKAVKNAKTKNKKILIIKLDAMGDVLRSTFLLPGIKELYGNSSEITWVVAPESVEILKGNNLVKRIWAFDKNLFRKILEENFDVVINLDLSPLSLSLATLSNSAKKVGYWLNKDRTINASNSAAKHWLLMSAFDDEKRKNKKTYQHHMSKIAGLKKDNYEIMVPLAKQSLVKAAAFAKKYALKKGSVIGVNPGAGGRWQLKKWTEKGYIALCKEMVRCGYKVVLFGGPKEDKLVKDIQGKAGKGVVSAGTNNSIADFFAFVNLCDIFVCGDTLALHAALGLKKKVVALFGPTSAPEIEMYNRGPKMVSAKDCVCCYITECSKKPSCMDMIKLNDVLSAVKGLQ